MVSVRPGSLPQLERKIVEIEERLRSLEPVLRVQAELFRGQVLQQSFGRSEDPWGQPWKPLEPATVQRRRRGSRKPLIDTGALRQAVHAEATARGLRIGVSGAAATYAATHQFGRDGIPARAFLPIRSAHGRPDFSGHGWASRWYGRFGQALVRWITLGTAR